MYNSNKLNSTNTTSARTAGSHSMGFVIVGLQYGDEGKGKVVNHLIGETTAMNNEDPNVVQAKFDYCVRFNGGPNAGHTIYHNNKKLITHQIPSGIIHGITSVIGSGCVVDVTKLEQEIKMLEENGFTVRDLLKIAYNAHIIQPKHVEEDKNTDKIGSTKSGIRPVYRDKYNRSGVRANTLDNVCSCEIVDPYLLFNKGSAVRVMFEGAQGFMLDVDWGNYPYVTSSSCLASGIATTGFNFRNIDRVIGVAKIYNTYVGKMEFQPDDPLLDKLCELGQEFGSTTGRKRQCNWLNLNELEKAAHINGVDSLIINKCDILEQLGVFKLYHDDELKEFDCLTDLQVYICDHLKLNITFSSSPTHI